MKNDLLDEIVKRRQEHMAAARHRVAERVAQLKKNKRERTSFKPPRYDDVFFDGMTILNMIYK